MSGGSFDYLFIRDGYDLGEHEQDLNKMVDTLLELGYAEDAAREAYELLLILRQSRVRMDVIMKRLSGVFKAVEWWQNCDSTEDAVKEALTKYRFDNA